MSEQKIEYLELNDRIANPELQAAYDEDVQKASEAQPLTADNVYLGLGRIDISDPAQVEYERQFLKWKESMQAWKEQQIELPEPKHIHGPFVFLLNQNHNALRGCQTCGAAWVGSMAGNEDNLVWHPVRELEEE